MKVGQIVRFTRLSKLASYSHPYKWGSSHEKPKIDRTRIVFPRLHPEEREIEWTERKAGWEKQHTTRLRTAMGDMDESLWLVVRDLEDTEYPTKVVAILFRKNGKLSNTIFTMAPGFPRQSCRIVGEVELQSDLK